MAETDLLEVTMGRRSTAEWIRREQERKVSHMDWMRLQTMEIASYLSRAHNWKSPGNDEIQNYWLKAFPATHRHIMKNFSAIIEELEEALTG